MSVDTNIPNLVINKLTKQQYEGTVPSNTELYFVTDEDAYISSNQGSVNAGKALVVGNDGTVSPQPIPAPANMQTTINLVTSVSSSSTDSQYPSAKLFYDTCGDIETLINNL